MPVDQTGETILFAWGDGFVEAHVQIEYDGGDATRFAWIVPVVAVPEIEVGSFRLIQAALNATVPQYGLFTTDTCGGGVSVGFIMDLSDGGDEGGFEPPPEIVVKDTVGVFDYVVLQGGTSATIGQWLADNGYADDPEAPAILDAYIEEGHVFVAFKLQHAVDIADLHPVVIRYAGDEPCIPLRLTRVAAQDDMSIRALFLGDARVMPVNYRHVLLNRARLIWPSLGSNYDQLVINAVDAAGADGHGFVTEYAGASNVVDASSLSTARLDPVAFVDLAPTEVVAQLAEQGLIWCSESACAMLHELVPSLLHAFLPVPPGLTDDEFYGCLPCHADQIDAAAWDGAAFAAALEERIVGPLTHARELLDTWPYLTRLHTRISPHEMTVDPIFAEVDGLDDVPNRYGAQSTIDCCGTEIRLPGGRVIELDDSSGWPVWPDTMPWAERIEELQPSGPPVLLVNLSDEIDAIIAAWNAAQSCDATGDGSGSASDTGSGGLGTSADDPTTVTTESPPVDLLDPDDGCACRSTLPRPSPAFAWLALGLRRRRQA